MTDEDIELHDKLYCFITDAISILEKTYDVQALPKTRKYIPNLEGNGFDQADFPDWSLIAYHLPKDVLELSSLKAVDEIINAHSQIRSRLGKDASAFQHGQGFSTIHLPLRFLGELIRLEEGLKFSIDIYNELFERFLNYIYPDRISLARIIVPLNNLIMETEMIELDSDLRIRSLALSELATLINKFPYFMRFSGLHSQQSRCILEWDVPFMWSWKSYDEPPTPFEETFSQSIYYIEAKINQEIVILRSLLNHQITAITYAIEKCSWHSELDTMGFYTLLPWWGSGIFSAGPLTLTSQQGLELSAKRNKFISIPDKKVQQRIFVAMRKLAYCMDKPFTGDRIMDAVSGLEGLLVEKDIETSHRFRERVALLLENEPEKRQDLMKEMKKAYGFRSSVAHGDVAADYFDSIISPRSLTKLDRENIEEANKWKYLTPRIIGCLNKAIEICIDRQTTKFKWDSAILGTRVDPY